MFPSYRMWKPYFYGWQKVGVTPKFRNKCEILSKKCVNGSRPPLGWVWGEDGNDVFVDHVFVDEFLNHRRLTGNFGSHFTCKDLPSTAKHQADHRACADLFALYMFNLPGLSSHPLRHRLWLGSLTTAGRCCNFSSGKAELFGAHGISYEDNLFGVPNASTSETDWIYHHITSCKLQEPRISRIMKS